MTDDFAELIRRVAENPLGPGEPQETARGALERRIEWLGTIWPGSPRRDRVAAALDDLTDEQRTELAEETAGLW